MYVLEPWARTTVRGWRTSLREVRRFTFVEEETSYAARSGKANARMGWIEVSVFRERRPPRRETQVTPPAGGADRQADPADRGAGQRSAEAPSAAPEAAAEPQAGAAGGRARSHPGTGWGDASIDPAVVVEFDPERRPAERITLRYEYRDALVALGVLPPYGWGGDRLAERERGSEGFAESPRW